MRNVVGILVSAIVGIWGVGTNAQTHKDNAFLCTTTKKVREGLLSNSAEMRIKNNGRLVMFRDAITIAAGRDWIYIYDADYTGSKISFSYKIDVPRKRFTPGQAANAWVNHKVIYRFSFDQDTRQYTHRYEILLERDWAKGRCVWQ